MSIMQDGFGVDEDEEAAVEYGLTRTPAVAPSGRATDGGS